VRWAGGGKSLQGLCKKVGDLCASAPLRLIRPYNPRMTIHEITEAIIGAAIEVHRTVGIA
jgi:hypothetical protein